MVSRFSTRKIILNILPELKRNKFKQATSLNLSPKIFEFLLRCISVQTGYIALAMEFTKLQIMRKHFKGGSPENYDLRRKIRKTKTLSIAVFKAIPGSFKKAQRYNK